MTRGLLDSSGRPFGRTPRAWRLRALAVFPPLNLAHFGDAL